MPCSDTGFDSGTRTEIIYRKGHDPKYKLRYQQLSKDFKKLQKRNDQLASFLCSVGRARKNKTDIPPEVLKWWEEHCEIDRLRGEPW